MAAIPSLTLSLSDPADIKADINGGKAAIIAEAAIDAVHLDHRRDCDVSLRALLPGSALPAIEKALRRLRKAEGPIRVEVRARLSSYRYRYIYTYR
jgi:hypothetical protein